MAKAPEWPRTVHCIGDLHAGAITDGRLDAVDADVQRLPGDWVCALGNHDILGNSRTVGAWAHAYGQESQNLSVDLGFVRVVVIGPDRNEPGRGAGLLSPATLEFLDRELERARTDCWIACHWPLFGTVMGDPRTNFTSAMAAFHAKPDDRIRELLAGRPNARAGVSALVGVGRTRDPRAPLCSVYLTHHAGRIEVHCRDHSAGRWRDVA